MSVGPQFLSFSVAGAFGFVADVGVLWGLHLLGVPLVLGRIPAILAAVTVTWVLNRRFTFKTRDPHRFREYLRTLTANGFGVAANFATFWFVLHQVPDVGTVGAFLAGSLVAFAINFVGSRHFAFRWR